MSFITNVLVRTSDVTHEIRELFSAQRNVVNFALRPALVRRIAD